MKLSADDYQLQADKAKELLVALERYHRDIMLVLAQHPDNTTLNRELERVLLDMIITENEIERAQFEWSKITSKKAV